VLKIGSHFKSQTGRATSLKQFCEQLDTNYSTLPTHTPTQWTTLDAVLERMIDLWEPLKAHFLSLKHPPRILEDFFKSDESLFIISFLHSVLLVFQKPLLLLQMTNALSPELTEIIESFRCKILQRQSSKFFGPTTAELLRKLMKSKSMFSNQASRASTPSPWNISVSGIDLRSTQSALTGPC